MHIIYVFRMERMKIFFLIRDIIHAPLRRMIWRILGGGGYILSDGV